MGKACNASGSLSSSVFVLTLEEPIEKVSTYGYKGGFSGGLETLFSGVPENNSVEDIYVSFDSVTIDDHMIRGLIYNGSDTSFARGVTVSALIRGNGSSARSLAVALVAATRGACAL